MTLCPVSTEQNLSGLLKYHFYEESQKLTLPKCVCLCLLFKANVEGDNCDRCKPDTFGLSVRNPLGCSNCYCYGLTRSCTEAQGLIRMWVSRQIITVLLLCCYRSMFKYFPATPYIYIFFFFTNIGQKQPHWHQIKKFQ